MVTSADPAWQNTKRIIIKVSSFNAGEVLLTFHCWFRGWFDLLSEASRSRLVVLRLHDSVPDWLPCTRMNEILLKIMCLVLKKEWYVI